MALTLLNLKDAAEIYRLNARSQEKAAKEAFGQELFGLLAGDSEDARYRRITSPATLRDLNPAMHQRMQEVCFFLFMTNPYAKRIVRVMVEYVVGEGFRASAEDPRVQEVIDKFWRDPVNNLDESLDNWATELLVFGELCLPVAVNPGDGFVRIAYVDPHGIESVQFGSLETAKGPELSIPVSVQMRARIGEAEGRRLDIIRVDEEIDSADFGQLKGDCFYFAINRAKGASRGVSELFALADWVDVFDNMMFDFADRVRLLNSFVWHYVVKGADDAALEKFRSRVMKSPPRQGGMEFTNENVEINARTPDLRGADMSQASREVKLYGMGGAGLPAWFFADPVDANRATAEEMAGPTGKMLTSKQNIIKRVVTAILDYVIERALASGELPSGVDTSWKLQVPDLSVKDVVATASAAAQVANAAGIAEERGWIRSETASRAFQLVLSHIGVEFDADEFDLAQADKTQREAKQQDALNPQSQLALAIRGKQQKGELADMPPATERPQ